MTTRALAFLDEELAALDRATLLRHPPSEAETRHEGQLVLCSNDYLGFGSEPLEPASLGVPGGSGASPVVVGLHACHLDAEAALCSWLGTEAALLFTSGYAANVGTLGALLGREDVVVSDRLNHASIIDGIRLSGARVEVTPHLDVAEVERALGRAERGARRKLVVVESYYSMDADGPDLGALRGVCDRHGAILYVDEAHALGVFGPEGRGRCAAAGVTADVLVGTLGKAIGLQGAFVTGSPQLRTWLWNRARSFVFSTASSPALAASVRGRVARVRGADDRRARVLRWGAALREVLRGCRGWVPPGEGPIVPWVIGAPDEAVRLSRELQDRGLLARPIRPPTVPEGSSRLRMTVHAGLDEASIERVARALREVGGK